MFSDDAQKECTKVFVKPEVVAARELVRKYEPPKELIQFFPFPNSDSGLPLVMLSVLSPLATKS